LQTFSEWRAEVTNLCVATNKFVGDLDAAVEEGFLKGGEVASGGAAAGGAEGGNTDESSAKRPRSRE
jgi:hypothetical protein